MKNKLKETQTPISSEDTNTSTSNTKRLSVARSRKSLSDDRPTPLDFDAFVPWVCLEWQMPVAVVIKRIVQEDYIKQENRRSSSQSRSIRSISSKFKQNALQSTDRKKNISSQIFSTDFRTDASSDAQFVPIKAIYDTKEHLIEIAIIDCPLDINRKVIQAFSICMPFHSLLTKLTIRKGGLTSALLYDISKMLHHSNLTDICLDDCKIPLENYGVLLDRTSQLKCLSLNRCNIDNAVCKNLSAKIDFGAPGCSLLVLELGSNLISDMGAIAIGQSLRRNRRLLHLNLAGNNITDIGASALLTHLSEFPLTGDEIYEARQRKLKYTKKKLEVYASCYEEILKRQRAETKTYSVLSGKSLKTKNLKHFNEETRKTTKRNSSVVGTFVEEKPAVSVADAMTMEILGEFVDPYDENSIVKRDGHSHSKGNMVLCSLNLAYNNMSFISIQKIYGVLKYQERLDKTDGATGLMRVVFEGNQVPVYCVEYERIAMILKKVIRSNTPSSVQKKKTRATSAYKKF